MSQYAGGKQKNGQEIAQIITEMTEEYSFNGYLEPFCGMLGVYKHITAQNIFKRYLAGDLNVSLILMWQALQTGWTLPHKCAPRVYEKLRKNGQSSALKGFIGHACSQRGIYFAPFDQRRQSLLQTIKRISDINIDQIKFSSGHYTQFSKARNFVIYLDPPYFKSSRYYDEHGNWLKFNYEEFYAWAEKMAGKNIVFITENSYLPYTLIKDFGNEQLYLIEPNVP